MGALPWQQACRAVCTGSGGTGLLSAPHMAPVNMMVEKDVDRPQAALHLSRQKQQ